MSSPTDPLLGNPPTPMYSVHLPLDDEDEGHSKLAACLTPKGFGTFLAKVVFYAVLGLATAIGAVVNFANVVLSVTFSQSAAFIAAKLGISGLQVQVEIFIRGLVFCDIMLVCCMLLWTSIRMDRIRKQEQSTTRLVERLTNRNERLRSHISSLEQTNANLIQTNTNSMHEITVLSGHAKALMEQHSILTGRLVTLREWAVRVSTTTGIPLPITEAD